MLIHYEPTQKKTMIYALPLKDSEQYQISPHFGEAPYFALVNVRIKDKSVIDYKIISNPFGQVEHGKGILVAELLNKYSIDIIITKESFEGKGPFYVFSNAAVENMQTEKEIAGEALDEIGIHFNPAEIKTSK